MKRLIPIDPQPTYEWIRPIVDQKTGEVHAYCDKDPTRYFCPHKPGDKLTVTVRPMRDGEKGGMWVTAKRPTGEVLMMGGPITDP